MRIFPSIVAKNQAELDFLLKKLRGVAPTLHLDVVDGKFAYNNSLHFKFKLNKNFKYNIHLMVQDPVHWIQNNCVNLVKPELIISQFETVKDKEKYISEMKHNGMKIAFAITPETTVAKLKPYLSKVDYVLVLTVHPGFYGGKYLKQELKKIPQIKKINHRIKVIVDGGMNPVTIKDAAKAGADYFVSGSFVSKADDPKKAIKMLEKAISNR